MDGMRDLLRSSLGRALRELDPVDRLGAAWPVAAGTALAGHGIITGYADGVLTVIVEDGVWSRQLESMREQLTRELGRIAKVPMRTIHFERPGDRQRAAVAIASRERRAVLKKIARPGHGARR